MTRLKELLEQRLAGRSGVYVLCEELEILEEEWRDTLEGYLNTQRFDLLASSWMSCPNAKPAQRSWLGWLRSSPAWISARRSA